jgi:hypothetical protein
MARAHLFRPVTDELGNLLFGATVTVRQADLNTSIIQPIYTGPTGDTVLTNPLSLGSGFVDIWLDTPERVNLLVQSTGRPDISIYLDVQPPATEVVRSAYPLTITNLPLIGQVLTGTDGSDAAWADPPALVGGVPTHYHPGTGATSVALGTGAVASATSSTAVGVAAQATAANATAFGQAAVASAAGATALGSTATASDIDTVAVGFGAAASQQGATAVGYNSGATGLQATAIGGTASAIGDNSLALGYTASASGTGAVALGASSSASGLSSLAVGTGATAANSNAVAVGPGATTTADNQIALGTSAHTVLALGNMQAMADAFLAGSGGTLGFFGSAGTTIQTVTGSRAGSAPLAALLTYLADIGLIIDASTV